MGFFGKLANVASGGMLGMAKGIKNKNLKAVASGGLYGGRRPQRPQKPTGFGMEEDFNQPQGPGGFPGVAQGLQAFRGWRGQQPGLGMKQGFSKPGFDESNVDPGMAQEGGSWSGPQLPDLNQDQLGGQQMPQESPRARAARQAAQRAARGGGAPVAPPAEQVSPALAPRTVPGLPGKAQGPRNLNKPQLGPLGGGVGAMGGGYDF